MTEDKARELAKRFGVRMCDENGNTHDEELYCLGLDDIIEMAKDLAQTGQSDLDAICQDLQEKTYNQAMRIAALEAQLAQPEQENQREAEVIDRIVAEHGYPKEFQYFAAALKANKPNNDDMLQEIARLHDRIKDLEADVEFLSRPPQPKEPEQEPVAWMTTEVTTGTQVWLYKKTAERYQNPPTPLYITPPQRTWVDLTDEEVLGLFGKFTSMTGKSWLDLYRMTEAKRKEKTHELDA